MGIIKSAEVPVGLSAFSMKDIEAAARGMLLRARQEAAEILSAARTEAEALRQAAHANGLAEGHAEGLQQGRADGAQSGHAQALAEHGPAMAQLVKSLTATAAQLEQRRDDLQTAALCEVVDLASAIARRITRRQGMIDPAVMLENLKGAMSLAVHAADVRIALHPSQMQTLRRELPNLQLSWPQLKHVELSEDASIVPGGVRIFTVGGQIDATLDTQLDRIIAELSPPNTPEQA
jgi:flagellar biosynthesis/type III secretory pathway protein FliH